MFTGQLFSHRQRERLLIKRFFSCTPLADAAGTGTLVKQKNEPGGLSDYPAAAGLLKRSENRLRA